jgi:short subunit dehydrogenase-like uncharacterized protein
VLTTVGPYAKYGSKLVAACVDNGTHYCDLAGETQWIRQMIDKHQSDAVQSGARIINSCGFDSIPSDIGVNFLQREAGAAFGEPCKEIVLLVKAMKGGASGGTIASMLPLLPEPAGRAPGTCLPGSAQYCLLRRCRRVDGAIRHGRDKYENRPQVECPARLRLRKGLPLQRGDQYGRRHRRLV